MKKITLIIFFSIIPITSQSQGIKGNIVNTDDPRVIFLSSAATALQPYPQIVAGYELYYSGLGGHGLQNGFVGFSYPHRRFGAFSLNGQYFTSEIYRTGNLSFGYGQALLKGRINLGVDLGMIFFSYNEDNFKLVDWNDPVFLEGTSKSAFDLGLSILAVPIDPLYIGLAVKHLNQPNISLIGDDIRIPIKFQSGVMFNNSVISPLINLEYSDDDLNWYLGLERWFFNRRAMVRANYYSHNFGATVAFIIPVQHNWLRFEYEYRYPLSELSDVSSASHLFMVSYCFSRQLSDFDIITRTNTHTIYPGESARYTIDIKRTGGFNDPINLNVSASDNNIDFTLIPERSEDDKSIVLTIIPSTDCLPGDYRFSITAQSKGKEKVSPISLTIKKRPALYADVQASVERLVIKETTRILSRDPLLPYIFFEEDQFSLNEKRYNILNPEQNRVKNFVFYPERLLDIPSKYKNTLNVIAKRLWDHPEMEITVRGYNSDWGVEKGNLDLSRRRAETVWDYLVKNCGVRPKQIKVEAYYLPPDPASNLDPRGREENQRVEITCPVASQPILEPIVTETSEIASSNDICDFQIRDFIAEAGLKKWKMTILETLKDTFKVFEGKNLLKDNIIWHWKNDVGQSVAVGKKYRYQLNLWDDFGQTFSTDWKEIQVESVSEVAREYIQKNIEKTRLILFKYDRADMDLSFRSLREELELIVQKLLNNPSATLLIQGHTDVIGDFDYNMRLSQRRAETVAKYFTDRDISKSRITYEGFGMTKPLMTNDLPEGRMMNRRVEIYILY